MYSIVFPSFVRYDSMVEFVSLSLSSSHALTIHQLSVAAATLHVITSSFVSRSHSSVNVILFPALIYFDFCYLIL